MVEVKLGRTGISVNKNGFGALPIQRISTENAVKLLQKAYHHGINFFDTARFYTDSEEKIGIALKDFRNSITIATKTMALTAEQFRKDLEESLQLLKTDHVDLYQFHNPPFCPKPGDGTGLYEAMLAAKQEGKIRFIGITNHRLAVAKEAIETGLYDTLQFPFSYLSTEKEEEIALMCQETNMGFIAMKALCGGLINNSAAAYAYLAQYSVVPIWGIQKERELDEFISYIEQPPVMDEDMAAFIAKEKNNLQGNFCRGCGYCLPCPVGIEINNSARMSLMVRRMPPAPQLTEEAQAKMKKIEDCIHCNQCKEKCPYGLDTPKLLQDNYQDYMEILAGKPLETV